MARLVPCYREPSNRRGAAIVTLAVSITIADLYTKLGSFIETVLPAGVPVIQLPVDRASMPPPDPGFVGMRLQLQQRIMTNLDEWDATDVDPSAIDITQAVRITAQFDCYGALSGDWSVILSTVLRDEFSMEPLAPILAPLYCDDPRFAPLVSGEEQYEQRWIVPAVMQYNPVVSTPMQFADTATADTINVDVSYPP